MELSVYPSRKEWIPGVIWLVLQATVIPVLMVLAAAFLQISLSESIFNFLFFCINFLATAIIFHRFLWASMKKISEKPLRFLGLVALGLVVYFIANFIGSYALLSLDLVTDNVNDEAILQMLEQDRLPMVIGIVFLVPPAEELMYRGTLFAPLYKHSKAGAFVLSVVLFSLAHIIGYIGVYDAQTLFLCFLQYIPASLSLAWIYAFSDNIFVSMTVHTAVNFLGIFVLR